MVVNKAYDIWSKPSSIPACLSPLSKIASIKADDLPLGDPSAGCFSVAGHCERSHRAGLERSRRSGRAHATRKPLAVALRRSTGRSSRCCRPPSRVRRSGRESRRHDGPKWSVEWVELGIK